MDYTHEIFHENEGGVAEHVPDLLNELAHLNDALVAAAAESCCVGGVIATLDQIGRKQFQLITQLREAYAALGMDFLTGLPLRGTFVCALAQTLRDAQRERDPYSVACLIIDADRLKEHNTLGCHLAGDALLGAVATAIRNNVAEINMVARLGGDEFGVYIPRCDLLSAETVAERIRVAVERTTGLVTDGSCSIGVAISSATIRTPKTLMKTADESTFVAKALGGNRVIIAA